MRIPDDGPTGLEEIPWSAAAGLAVIGAITTFWLARLILYVVWRRRLPSIPPRPRPEIVPCGILALFLYLGLGPLVAIAFRPLLGAEADAAPSMERIQLSVLITQLASMLTIALVWIFGRLKCNAGLADFGLGRPVWRAPAAPYLVAALLLASYAPAFLSISLFNAKLVSALDLEAYQPLVRAFLDDDEAASRIFLVLTVVLVVPVLEEVLFRGVVQRSLRAVASPLLSIVGTALLFAAVHDAQSSLPVFVIGLLLGLVCEISGSVWPSVLVHALFNGGQLYVILHVVGE